jgi:Putative adhesin
MHRLLRIVACFLLFTAFAAAETFENRQTQTFDFKPGESLRFHSEFGHVEVRSGDVPNVQLTTYERVETGSKAEAQKIFDDLAIDGRPGAPGLGIDAYFKNGWQERDYDDRGGRYNHCMSGRGFHSPRNDNTTYCLAYGSELREVSYTLTVPKKLNLDVETRAGHITISDIDGPVTATTAGGHITTGHIGGVANIRTAGGHIQVTDSTGAATLRTAGGHITIGDVGGNLIADTAGGHIETGHVKGTVHAKTAGGHIEIRQADGAVEAKTVGGSITALIATQPKDASYIETAAGSVNVELAGNVKLDVDAESSGGSIDSDLPLEGSARPAAQKDDDESGRWFRTRTVSGKLNGGGPKLEVRTTHGRITLTKASFQY